MRWRATKCFIYSQFNFACTPVVGCCVCTRTDPDFLHTWRWPSSFISDKLHLIYRNATISCRSDMKQQTRANAVQNYQSFLCVTQQDKGNNECETEQHDTVCWLKFRECGQLTVNHWQETQGLITTRPGEVVERRWSNNTKKISVCIMWIQRWVLKISAQSSPSWWNLRMQFTCYIKHLLPICGHGK